MSETLASIRQRAARVWLCPEDCPLPECRTEQDRARLLAALDAVLAIADDLISDITGADGVENEAQDEIRDQIAGRIRAAVNDALDAS